MKTSDRTFVVWLVAGIVGAGVLPILLYWLFFTGATGPSVDGARSLVAQASSATGVMEVRPLSAAKQCLAVITGFVIKPAHMLLCLALIVWLWRQRAPISWRSAGG